ncbi:hypothetical protein Q5H92_06670 [Hymenobacter sp. M29]|uniref:Uncharacterized protein n=1 Tax=Hymenobacter mellowenesis TaxID=3063995 RepID=A0ABT9A866_9BACT|nr:hypothetical protein [Hymenobacter sp. M29]MDO7846031.1 hypothetical protein [Hymenobacter sp. M29]
MKASFPRILGINSAIILSLAAAFRMQDDDSPMEGKGTGFIISLATAIFIQFFVNALLGYAARSIETRQSFFLAAMLTLLIGFGACIGGTYTY